MWSGAIQIQMGTPIKVVMPAKIAALVRLLIICNLPPSTLSASLAGGMAAAWRLACTFSRSRKSTMLPAQIVDAASASTGMRSTVSSFLPALHDLLYFLHECGMVGFGRRFGLRFGLCLCGHFILI